MFLRILCASGVVLGLFLIGPSAYPLDPSVYNIRAGFPMGNPGEKQTKDYFLALGAVHGVRMGSQIEVLRKAPSYDLLNEKLQRDVTFPIAVLKVIHVESNTSIARLEQMNPPETTPLIQPRAVLMGDLVRLKN